MLFFILTPLLIVPLFLVLPKSLSPQTMAIYILGLGGFGHHLPGFIRAYSDRALFARHKWSFTVVPLMLILLCGLYSSLNLNALAFLTVAWGTWHGAMQVNGFMRIYDSKAKSFLPATARLDRMMCIAWFGFGIFHSPEKQFSLAALFYGSGGFLVPAMAFEALRRAWDWFVLIVTLAFLVNSYRQWKAGAAPSPIKLLIMASSFAFWWYCMVTLRNLLLGVLMWEVFHDIQYNALVWHFQRHRVKGDAGTSAAERILFRPGWGRLALYAGLILAYGYIGVASSFASIQLPDDIAAGSGITQWLLRITLASALLHFYYDGFIWRVRQADIRRDLGVREESASAQATARAEAPKGFWSAWLWALFFIPAMYMGWAQHGGRNPDFTAQMLNLAEAVPGNWKAYFLAGTHYKGKGALDKAEYYYRKTVAARPDFATGHLFLGDVLYKTGRIPEAIDEYRQSADLDPENMDGKRNLANLYLKTGQPALAADQFRDILIMRPDDPEINYGMASSLLQESRLDEAQPYIEKTLRYSPHHSGALNYSGMIQDVRGNVPAAIALYRRALEEDSTNASAKENLAAALRKPAPNAP